MARSGLPVSHQIAAFPPSAQTRPERYSKRRALLLRQWREWEGVELFHRLLTEADNRTFWHGLSRRPFSRENAAPEPNFILVYVENPARSASFYARILGCDSVESSAVFVLFKLDSGGMLGLWGGLGVEPSATNPGGGKLAFALNDDRAVDRLRAEWSGLDIP